MIVFQSSHAAATSEMAADDTTLGQPLERATQALRETDKPIDNVMLQYLSPLGWEHINLTGDYVWRQSRKIEDRQFRPLRINGKP